MKKKCLIFSLLIFIDCKGKPDNDQYPEFLFRSDKSLLGESYKFGKFSLILPKNYFEVDSLRFNQLSELLKNKNNSFLKVELLKAFSDNGNSAILISMVNESNVFLKLDDTYKDYLYSNPSTRSIQRSSFKLNGINTIQYQINEKEITSIKLYFDIEKRFFCLDYRVRNILFDDKLEALESCLSSVNAISELKK
ncbi:MAG: hypothetical protein CMG74_03855 [Candidatus Marinimicrobia bacterium]|nr:hypothetical protein [Candidatus Neomarinimicrobiota bacterium]|tara:strand:+ start:10289 stop:10870 length:582 start_codon:yes stop_codon:yes gene_type:complete